MTQCIHPGVTERRPNLNLHGRYWLTDKAYEALGLPQPAQEGART